MAQRQLDQVQALRHVLPGVAMGVLAQIANDLAEQGRRQAINNAREFGNALRQAVMNHAGELGNRAFQIAETGAGRVARIWTEGTGLQEAFGGHLQAASDSIRELIPDLSGNAVVGDRRDREGNLRGNRRETPMEIDNGPPNDGEAQLARAGGMGGGPSSVSKETPISTYPSLSYGFQETHTTILPWTGWLSVAKVDATTPAQLQIRMNTPWDMINTSITAAPAAAGDPFTTKGFYAVPTTEAAQRAVVPFPEVYTNTVERPMFRDTWAALYDYYTVLGCEYKITIVNPISTRGSTMIVGTQFDTYSDTATTTGNVMPLTNLSEAMSYKNMRFNVVEWDASDSSKNTAVISGNYKPGQAKRNIVNDGDVKTWTATGAALPNLKEILTLNFWRAPLAWATNASNANYAANMQIELKYIVQFKDLKQQARYPNTVTTDQDITIVLNETATATGSALQRW